MEHTKIFNFEGLNLNFGKMIELVRAGKSCSVFGVQNSMRPALVSALGRKIFYLTADSIAAAKVKEQFEIMGMRVGVLPIIRDNFTFARSVSVELYYQRLMVLSGILFHKFDAIIAPIEAVTGFLPSEKKIRDCKISIAENEVIEIDALIEKLVQAGYKREEIIYGAGQFSRRGEVVDVFPINAENPFRIDFFDNLVESIKVFDLTTNRGTKSEPSLDICPCTDIFFNEGEVSGVAHKLAGLKKSGEGEEIAAFNDKIEEVIVKLSGGERGFNLDFIAPYIESFKSSIFDYLSGSGDEFVTIIDEAKQLYDALFEACKGAEEQSKHTKLLLTSESACCFSIKEVVEKIQRQAALAFLKITSANRFFESKAVFSYKSVPAERFVHNLGELSAEFKNYAQKGFKFFIFAGSSQQAEAVKNILSSHGIDVDISKSGSILSDCSAIFECGYDSGFILPEEKIYVLGTHDIFPKKRRSNGLKVTRESALTIPKVGDYVVHQYHGIGLCEGVTKLSGNFGTKDYVVIKYYGGDKLYVPTEQMDMLSRFSSAQAPAKLSKIGGADFSAVKEKVKKSIKKLAINLVELYAKREEMVGFAFSEDNDLQREFENSFPYTETEDQLKSVSEIKADMQSNKVMDRLLCGDVGFGKTEVALRACFKAIMDGKQVAFIAPTTILSEQHYNTAKARMFDFGVSIEVLNRFKSASETQRILSGIESGEVDLVCGTHRVLSEDVHFKNLGLIVLDEEHKFGVEHKEKLKEKYKAVDVLTLSATPIPRTLNMSLSGIRDISIIATPPSERVEIQTYVTELSDGLIKDALAKELARDGQAYVLFNNVEKIYGFAERVRSLAPDAKVAVAHGQMRARELENVIYDFYSHKVDVLVCTTIIENGIDIENANTLIVCDADRLGLSELYQIRGRVGRGARMAYAYLTYNYNKTLTKEAYGRLDAMSEFCELGSGFKLAMRDLEIRGGGNIFGAEQSGHMQKIGFDMYLKLLSEVVNEIRGEESDEVNVLIKVALDAYIPETYIATSEERMLVYKRISATDSLESAEKLKVELSQSFGKIPPEVLTLIDIALVRKLAGSLRAVEVLSLGAEVKLIFDSRQQITENEVLGETIFKFRLNCAIDLSDRPCVKFSKLGSVAENFQELKRFLLFSADIQNNLSKK